jgi:hypothetical protein
MLALPLLCCIAAVAADETPPVPVRDPFVQALTPPAAAAVNAQIERTAVALARITAAPPPAEPQAPRPPVAAPATAAPQPITLVLRGTAPDAAGVWVALIEEPGANRTLVVRAGQWVDLDGRVAQVTRIEHAMLLLQADGGALVLRQ